MSTDNIYTVVCTDLNDYVNWQVDLLEYSWSRINQPGKLVRLVACDESVELPEHRHAQVYRTHLVNSQPDSDDVYVCYNRLYSLQQWLQEEDIQGTILMVDCDVVFTKAIKTLVSEGNPIGQHWIDYGIGGKTLDAIKQASDIDVSSLQPVTWPMLIDANDLRALLPRWIEMTILIREQTKGQESDMFAFLVSLCETGLQFELNNIAAFMPWSDDKVIGSSLIHYCQVVKDENNEKVWGKWRYEPWGYISNPNDARLDYCKDLLGLINEFARLKNEEEKYSTETIFIAIASYCDEELVDTIQSCLQKARFPQNLRFGICHQYDNSAELTSEHCLDQFSQDQRFRYVLYDFSESQGGCWARNIAQQLYDDETYTLQIDSHTQMLESWDTILIDMMASLPSEKPLITQFPPLYSIEPDGKKYQRIEDLSQVNSSLALDWSTGGWLNHTQKLVPGNTQFPRHNRALSGAFVFTSGDWNRVVRQDPKFLYVGEEFALALRSFTHGYDLFDPNQIVCWHRLHPTQNRKFRNDNSKDVCSAKHELAIHRLGLLMNGDPENELGEFGLGKQRTLIEFAQLTGIDCLNKTLTTPAQEGLTIEPNSLDLQPDPQNMQIDELLTDTIIDVTIHTKTMAPLMLACYEETPVLMSLFEALKNKGLNSTDLIYLELGADGLESVYFKKSELVSVETSPALSDVFFNRLSAQTQLLSSNVSNQVEQALDHNRINDSWKIWIWQNVSRGVPKDEIFKQLVENGFDRSVVQAELGHEPSIPLEQITTKALQSEPQKAYQANAIAQRLENPKIEIYRIDDFLNQDECASLLGLIHENHVPSKVVSDSGGVVSDHRTSSSCSFDGDCEVNQLAHNIRLRLCRIIGINPSHAEPIQAQLYETGGEYKAHYDWFEPGTESFNLEADISKGGQRTWSVVVYLNDVAEGGETRFENAELVISPKQGRAVFWNNLDQTGMPSRDVLHQACPVIKGHKAILTLWFRSFGEGEMVTQQACDLIPAYTSMGIEKHAMSTELFNDLSKFYQKSTDSDMQDEHVPGEFLDNAEDKLPSSLIEIPNILRQKIIDEFLPVCEQWSQTQLQFSALYGLRVYARGTSLKMHVDIQSTHIISVILNVAQQVDKDWPLEIDDHVGRRHSIILQPGEIVLYEGARLEHGRPSEFEGDAYANIFLHFCPKKI